MEDQLVLFCIGLLRVVWVTRLLTLTRCTPSPPKACGSIPRHTRPWPWLTPYLIENQDVVC